MRILVVLDPAAPAADAIEAAAAMGDPSEVEGLFVEDANLLTAAHVPVAKLDRCPSVIHEARLTPGFF